MRNRISDFSSPPVKAHISCEFQNRCEQRIEVGRLLPQRRKLLYLADATENKAHELEDYLAERARFEEENKKAGVESQ
jgi:hypothetical protein